MIKIFKNRKLEIVQDPKTGDVVFTTKLNSVVLTKEDAMSIINELSTSFIKNDFFSNTEEINNSIKYGAED